MFPDHGSRFGGLKVTDVTVEPLTDWQQLQQHDQNMG